MRAPSPRARKIAGLSAAPVAVLLAGAMVWQGSTAAFTATTRNAGNSWESGQVALTDDDGGSAMFSVENLVPGDQGENCIVVTSNSTVPGQVRSYLDNLSASGAGLENRIQLSLERGSGGSFGDCTGFTPEADSALTPGSLAQVSTTHADYASGGAAWDTAGTAGEAVTYRATWEFDTTGMTQAQIDALQGARTSADIVWELQSDEPAAA
jgi:hypothetical protein